VFLYQYINRRYYSLEKNWEGKETFVHRRLYGKSVEIEPISGWKYRNKQ